MPKRDHLVKNASILMVASIISRIIGLIYRRPLGEVLGRVGLGYYGYASNLYAILLLISSYSIPMAVSKIVSERLALHRFRSAQKVFRGALLYAVLIGGATALIAFFGGRFLLPANQLNALPALRVLAPTIFLSAILGVLRGYFQAHRSMAPTSISQIIEQIANAVVSILAAWLLIRTFAYGGGTEAAIFGAMGGTMGTGAGVIAGLLFMLFVYWLNRGYFKRERMRDRRSDEETYGEVLRVLALMITPVIFTTFVNNASAYLDSYLFSSLQGWRGVASETISGAYGEYSNYFIPLVNIPLAMASASASAMMPEVSGLYALNDHEGVNAQVHKTLRLTMFICIPAMIGLAVLSKPIMGVLFPSSTEMAARLLLSGSLYVLFATFSTINGSVLQSIGKQRNALRNAAIALGVNLAVLAVMLILMPKIGIYAVMIAMVLFSAFYGILNSYLLRKFLGFRNEYKRTYLQPLLAAAVMGAVAYGVYRLLFLLTRRPSIALLVAIVVAIPVYLVGYVVATKTTREEMLRYPMGTKIVRVLEMLRIYR